MVMITMLTCVIYIRQLVQEIDGNPLVSMHSTSMLLEPSTDGTVVTSDGRTLQIGLTLRQKK